jgi:hypothetical protein
MKKACCKFLMVFLSLFLVSTAQAGSGPKIVIKEKVFHFKELVEGQTIEHVFNIQNPGDQPLEIQNVKPG